MSSKLREVLIDELGVSPELIKPEARLVEDLGMDSLDALEVAMGLEEEFDVEISDEALATWETVADLQACIGDESDGAS